MNPLLIAAGVAGIAKSVLSDIIPQASSIKTDSKLIKGQFSEMLKKTELKKMLNSTTPQSLIKELETLKKQLLQNSEVKKALGPNLAPNDVKLVHAQNGYVLQHQDGRHFLVPTNSDLVNTASRIHTLEQVLEAHSQVNNPILVQ